MTLLHLALVRIKRGDMENQVVFVDAVLGIIVQN